MDGQDDGKGEAGFSAEAFLERIQKTVRERGNGCGNFHCHGRCQPNPGVEAEKEADEAQKQDNRDVLTEKAKDTNDVSHTTGVNTPKRQTFAPYADSLLGFRDRYWGVLLFQMTPHCGWYNQYRERLMQEIQVMVLTRIVDRCQYLEIRPGNLQPIIHLAGHMRSLKKVILIGQFSRPQLVPVTQFLQLRNGIGNKSAGGAGGSGIEICNLPTIPQSVESGNPHIHHFHPPLHHHHAHETEGQQQQLHLQLQHLDFHRKQQQLEVIIAMGRPKEMDTNDCHDFSALSQRIPCQVLARLERFQHVLGFLEGDGGKFLRRCRRLRELDFAAFDRDVFSWAFIEKQKAIMAKVKSSSVASSLQRTEQDGSSSASSLLSPVLAVTLPIPISVLAPAPSLPLVQLTVVRMAVSQWMTGRILRSLLEGFSHSLESVLYNVYDNSHLGQFLCRETVERLQHEASKDLPYRLDRHLFMPKLKKLRLVHVTSAVEIGPGAFDGCPELDSLSIGGSAACVDGRTDYGLFKLPKLTCLELGPTAGARFNFESLKYLPKLESFALRDMVPLAEELQPDLTLIPPKLIPWTWTLPVLTQIQVTGRPAAHFRFQWIRQCPTLEVLVIEGVPSAALQFESSELKSSRTSTSFPSDDDNEENDDEDHPSLWKPIESTYGPKLHRCTFQIHHWHHHEINKFRLRKLLELYCSQVQVLRLTGKLGDVKAIPLPPDRVLQGPVLGRGNSICQWQQVSMDLAIKATFNLKNLKSLILCPEGKLGVMTNYPYTPNLNAYKYRYGLVLGMRSKGCKTPAWCQSMDLKTCQIEVLDEVEPQDGITNVYRQLTSWVPAIKEQVVMDTHNEQGHVPRHH
ncbi:hypothetical protein EMPS_09274 [Entomortierella parvispora]|uniref:F-box domain-containing protein n=1 Tax=Entomortierella parvispora TaxID=205924 RepID=A0A9P3M0F6_9FUNG|nr:hypothetical protein EMPS_09274 [Entomortierella parvispora]